MLNLISTLDYLTWSFFAFVLIAFVIVTVARDPWRRHVLLACNVLFLANLLSWPALCLYAVLTLSTYFAGVFVARGTHGRRLVFHASVVVLIGLFFVLRAPVVREAFGANLEGAGSLGRQVAVVLGYSYFMFKGINYLIAAYVGSIRNYSLLNYLNFIFLFSCFTAGPIGRYADYQDEDLVRRVPADDIVAGLHRILNGLIKKYVLVDIIAQFSLAAFDSPDQIRSVPVAWAATWAYLLYIYVDFSAYSDIAIGIGLLFGYRLPENFDFPLLKRNLVLFWEHWHMSLTAWVRDHVFAPLSWRLLQRRGFRGGDSVFFGVPHVVTMAIFGIWHAPTLAFLVFGVLHGAALAATQKVIALRREHLGEAANRFVENNLVAKALGTIAVNVFVALSLILIRYDLGDSVILMRFLFTGAMP